MARLIKTDDRQADTQVVDDFLAFYTYYFPIQEFKVKTLWQDLGTEQLHVVDERQIPNFCPPAEVGPGYMLHVK